MNREWVIDGFCFGTEQEVVAAEKELEGIRYIQERLNTSRPDAVLQVYLKLIQDDMFHTPVGLCYLKELQTILEDSELIMPEEIVPIDVKLCVETAAEIVEEPQKNKKQQKEKKHNPKSGKTLIVVNIFLVLTIIGMFALSATSNVPTIVNYENKIINKYEQWEKELEEREEAVKQREQQLDSQNNNGDN